MKIGFTLNPYDNGFARFKENKFSKIAECGFSAVDYNTADTNTELYKMSELELERRMLSERNAAEQAGIEISQVHAPWRWPPLDSTQEQRAERMEKMKRSILLTQQLGCKHWVVHPIMPYGIEELNTENAEKTWDLNICFMSELLEFAKKQGVTICLENMPMLDFSLATPAQILKFVKAINDTDLKICLDTGHVAVFKELTIGGAVRELGKEIKALHIHDNMGDRDAHLFPTYGCIDWSDFTNALKEIGFDGVFSLEVFPDEALDDISFLKVCTDLYGIAHRLIEGK